MRLGTKMVGSEDDKHLCTLQFPSEDTTRHPIPSYSAVCLGVALVRCLRIHHLAIWICMAMTNSVLDDYFRWFRICCATKTCCLRLSQAVVFGLRKPVMGFCYRVTKVHPSPDPVSRDPAIPPSRHPPIFLPNILTPGTECGECVFGVLNSFRTRDESCYQITGFPLQRPIG